MKTVYTQILTAFLFVMCSNMVSAQNEAIHYIDQQNCKKVHFFDSLNFTPTNYSWNFGDGNTSTQGYVTHTYASNGTYTVTFYAYDSASNTSANDTLTVIINCGPCTNFKARAWSYVDGNNCKKVHFVNTSPTATYSWNFGDGNTSSQKSPSHTYSADGNYTSTLIISDSLCTDTTTVSISIKCNANLCDSFYAFASHQIDTGNCKKVNFTNYSPSGTYTWNFGDGNTSTASSPTHTYASTGTYTVVLTASDSSCSDSFNLVVQITCTPPNPCKGFKAILVLSVDSLNNSIARLYNRSTGNVTNHFWDFGDGTTSTLAAPSHTYTTPGTITLTYTAEDSINQCIDTATITFTIDSSGNIRRGDINVVLNIVDQTQNSTHLNLAKETFQFKVYPNPSQGQFTIQADAITPIRIYNTQGKLVKEVQLGAKESVIVDGTNWSSGMYYLVTPDKAVHKIILE